MFSKAWCYQVLLFTNYVIKLFFPRFGKVRHSFERMLSKLAFWVKYPDSKTRERAKACGHKTTLAYNIRCNSFIKKWKTCSITSRFNNHTWKCYIFAFKNNSENVSNCLGLLSWEKKYFIGNSFENKFCFHFLKFSVFCKQWIIYNLNVFDFNSLKVFIYVYVL